MFLKKMTSNVEYVLHLIFNLEQNLGRGTLGKPKTLGKAKYDGHRKKLSERNV